MRAALLLTALLLAALAEAQQLPVTELAAGMHLIRAEVADSDGSRAQGLMFRESMPTNAGMVFVFDQTALHCMWMKNTLIPLDMVFIRPDGTIARIATAKALDLTPVPSGEPISAVLELRGGRAAELGIRAGDRVDWPH